MILIIAEKPSVMKNIIAANLENFHPKSNKGFSMGKDIIYTHCIGHLLTLKMPREIDDKYISWSINNLPFSFDNIPLKVNPDVKEQYDIVNQLINRSDITEVINACDSDREGDLIFRNLFHHTNSGVKNVTRMWIESQTPDGIRDSFNNRLKEAMYNNVYFAGKSRSYADYIVGLNSTMAMTNKFAKDKEILTVGRVQTPTLRIIVDLEREILNFKPKDFYKINAIANSGAIEIKAGYVDKDLDSNRFDTKADAQAVVDKIGTGEALVTEALTTSRNEKPKLLYSLSDLQIDMDKRYSMAAIDVLNTCQSLYETHKLITYPRTDENHISQSLANKSNRILNSLVVNSAIRDEILNNNYKINPIMIAKKGIGAHEALTPTDLKHDQKKIDSLTLMEKNVYMAIVERYMAAFFPDAIIEKQKIQFERNKGVFQSEFEMVTSPGHQKAYIYNKKSQGASKSFIAIKKGDTVIINKLNLEEGKTQAPSRFTEGSLIKMMKNPVKYVSDKNDKDVLKKVEGIGTEATRASIIVELKKRGLIETDKKKNILPTQKGMDLIDIIPSEIIKSVSLTAMFERKLSMISEGTYNHLDFLNEIKEMEAKFINDVKDIDRNYLLIKTKYVCDCPVCASPVVEKELGYFCTNNMCKVAIFKNTLGSKLITKTQATEMLTGGVTLTKVLCLSQKTGKDFESVMRYKYDPNAKYPNIISFDFSIDAPSCKETEALAVKPKAICKCPRCESDIIESEKTYYCSNKECNVMIYKVALGCKGITKKACKELFTKGITSTRLKCITNNNDEIEVYLSYTYKEGMKYPNIMNYVYNKIEEDNKE